MAIKLTDKIHTVAAGVDTVNRGSAQANAGREAYTLQEVSDLIGGGGGAVDSIAAGDGVTVSAATGNVTVSAKIGGTNADDFIALFTADDAVNASRIATTFFTSNIPTGGILTYGQYSFGELNNPVIAVFQKTSMILFQTQDTAPTSASTGGLAGQVVLYHGDETDADNGIYVCVVSGAAGAAKWTKSALTNV
jgi:hypothetical protein|tara:strand:+ start:40 stop:618 length:579 start_codon:yes stop_codon:yes gene_type:complete